MAYDKALAARIRKVVAALPKGTEKEQFGGVGVVLKGKLARGGIGTDFVIQG